MMQIGNERKRKYFLKFLLTLIDDILVVVLLIFVLLYLNIYSIWVDIGIVIIVVCVIVFSTYVFLPQFKKPVVGPEVLNGLTGVVVEKLDPQGRVDVNGEIWTAVSSYRGCVEEGEKVLVEKIDGNKLVVRKEKNENVVRNGIIIN